MLEMSLRLIILAAEVNYVTSTKLGSYVQSTSKINSILVVLCCTCSSRLCLYFISSLPYDVACDDVPLQCFQTVSCLVPRSANFSSCCPVGDGGYDGGLEHSFPVRPADHHKDHAGTRIERNKYWMYHTFLIAY
jgi:hypothetical protein